MHSESIKKNFFFKIIYEILKILTPLVTAPYVARIFGAEGVGIYSYSSAYLSYFVLVAALGTPSYGTRMIAKSRDKLEDMSLKFWEIEVVSIISTLLCLLIWVIFAFSYRDYRIYLIALTPTLIANIFDISWFYTGIENVKFTVICNSICKIIGLICLFSLINDKSDLVLYIIINSLLTLLGNISMWFYLPKFISKVKLSEINIKPHFIATFKYFAPTIAVSVYQVLDKVLIGLITNDVLQNGYYEQATKIINLLKTLVYGSINSIMTARMSYLCTQNNYLDARKYILQTLNYILFMGVGCVFGIISVSSEFVPFFFGNGYEGSIPILNILSVILVIIGISNCIGNLYFIPTGHIQKVTLCVTIGAIINATLNIGLIPSLGAYGAALATVVAEFVILILSMQFSKDVITIRDLFKYIWKKMIAGIVMMISIYGISVLFTFSTNLSLIIKIVVGAIAYCLTLILLCDSSVNEVIKLVKERIKGK